MTASINASISEIHELMQQAINKNDLPGAVIMISRKGELVHQQAYGWADIESQRPHRLDDLFYLGSTSKPLAVSSILTLVDSGRLDLDETASTWIPELSHCKLKLGKISRPPTIRELLSHTSGIFGNATASPRQQRLVWNFGSSLAETAILIAKQPYIYEPGKGFSYGGASMTIASRIAELVSGKEFDDFTNQAMFSRTGMTDTFYRTEKLDNNRFSPLYKKHSGGLYKAQFQPHATPDSFVLPAGGIISTAHDLSRFIQLHLESRKKPVEEVLSNGLMHEMKTDATHGQVMDFQSATRRKSTAAIANNKGYGLGWMLDEYTGKEPAKTFFHGGAFGTLIWGNTDEQLGIVLLSHVPLAHVADLWDRIITITRNACR